MQTKTLFISAGHSDAEPDAVGNGYTEACIVLEFRDLLAGALRARSVEFSKDGEPDQNLALSKAWRMAAEHDIALEFHCNAFHLPSATGVAGPTRSPISQSHRRSQCSRWKPNSTLHLRNAHRAACRM